jgi:hypothetical protein
VVVCHGEAAPQKRKLVARGESKASGFFGCEMRVLEALVRRCPSHVSIWLLCWLSGANLLTPALIERCVTLDIEDLTRLSGEASRLPLMLVWLEGWKAG